jgi:acetyltransferase-like isoleucine patch superfamily enzyme
LRLKSLLVLKMKIFINLILPNIFTVFTNKVTFTGNYPVANQKTFITGDGNVVIGKNCAFGYKPGGFHRGGSVELQPRYKSATIIIGDNVATNNNVFFCAANLIEVGDDTLIGQNVTVIDHEAHNIDPLKRRQTGEIGKVIIGKNVWIGNNVTILKNSIIGDNTVIASGAVVSGEFGNNIVIGGVPAKIIKEIK